ncbi:hypothetical protein K469DRAFT_697475 [Zopfia rhizophila CBS 207.26]|uniref:Mid2 domain-containing protein n=1 Tax=Zopfia rhizophila CBS 207.26 TaxID=1314779 RepID=A0A6A6DDA6_9PEZI|nr:hypothetical protein K469DRAFT_697475 [Zopfia rhizophila CBS 207.26]
MIISTTFAFIYGVLSINAAQAECFYPNGTNRNLNPAKGHWMPCNEAANDECQENGLCSNANGLVWREGCTDPTWESPSCLKLCTGDHKDKFGNWYNATDIVITQCEDGSLCCGGAEVARDCCKAGKGVRIKDGEVLTSMVSSLSISGAFMSSTQTPGTPTSNTASSTTSFTIPQSDSTSMPRPSAAQHTSDPEPPQTTYTPIIAGSIIGGVLALISINVVLCLLMRRRKRARELGLEVKTETTFECVARPVPHWELDGESVRPELSGIGPTAELKELP